MAKKHPPREETRRQIAISQKEKAERRRVMMIMGGIALLIALILIGGGVYTYIMTPNQALAEVNGQKITRQDYQKRVLYERYLLDEQASFVQLQLQQLAQSLQDSPELLQSLEGQANQQLQQIASQRFAVDRDALDLLIESKLAEEEAAKRGISVSDAEIQATYQEVAAARQGGYTEASAAETVEAGRNATATAAMFTPTPTLSATEVTAAEPATASQPTPTINVVSGDALSQAIADWEKIMSEQANMTPADLKALIRAQLLREKLYEALGEDIETAVLQAHVRHILLEDIEAAWAAKQRLENGEDFAEVAVDVSTDPSVISNNGDLGWFPRKTMVPEFDDAAFTLPVGEISEPIKTDFGFHIIEILAREDRELDEQGLSREKAGAYNDWLDAAKASGVEDFWTLDDAPPDTNNPFGQ
ncbi:MAG TPA: hypothetical protein G4N96_12490 [Chloroflexi bacterium]|nr:hypothetical protein [Chloroflexota bacterium]